MLCSEDTTVMTTMMELLLPTLKSSSRVMTILILDSEYGNKSTPELQSVSSVLDLIDHDEETEVAYYNQFCFVSNHFDEKITSNFNGILTKSHFKYLYR